MPWTGSAVKAASLNTGCVFSLKCLSTSFAILDHVELPGHTKFIADLVLIREQTQTGFADTEMECRVNI